ncbi:hypothetical protein D3C80_351660 [compost metagenome]|jgi:hypothetical protein
MDDLEQINRIRAVELAVTGIIMALEKLPDADVSTIMRQVRDHRAKREPDSDETIQVVHFFDMLANL